jgi:hypothetical protein
MVLGQILTTYKNLETNDFIRVCETPDSLVKGIPTLIIGKKNVIRFIGNDNISYLDKKIDDNLYWTFGKTERRDEFERDVKKFNDTVIGELLKQVTYRYVNVFELTFSDTKKLLKFISKNDLKTFSVIDNTLYLYYDHIVYGISLNELEYIGVTKKKIYYTLIRNKRNIFIKNKYSISPKMRFELKNKIYLLPFIYYLEKEDSF